MGGRAQAIRNGTEAVLVEGAQTDPPRHEKDVADEFCQLYEQTRLMLVKEFQCTGGITEKEADAHAQTVLNRLMFVFFAGGRRLIDDSDIFSSNVRHIVCGQLGKTTKRVWAYLVDELFAYFEKGSNDPHVPKFNVGLFRGEFPEGVYFYDKRDAGFFRDIELKIPKPGTPSWEIKKRARVPAMYQKNLNPVIKNLLMLSSYDFESQVSVSVLGRIFENSVRRSEDIRGHGQKITQNDSRRRREGVFYTPEPIARYICRNTIIPHLSKSGTNDVHALIGEYADDLPSLEQRLRETRILDPACGSGVFLVEAANILIAIYGQIQRQRSPHGNFNKNTLDKAVDGAKIRSAVKNSLYGIDISVQAVEITKMSLFLMTASRGEKIQDLSENFAVGNSVVYSENFNWNAAFPKLDAFDIIIGNPPYVRHEGIRDKDSMQLPPHAGLGLPGGFKIPKTSDLSSYFYYHSLLYLRPGGKIGFITSDSWLHWSYGASLQKRLLGNCRLDILMKTDFNAFRDADVKTVTAILTKRDPSVDAGSHMVNIVNVHDRHFGNQTAREIPQRALGGNGQQAGGSWALSFVKPMPQPRIPMIAMSKAGAVRMGIKTGHNAFFVIGRQAIEKYRIGKRHHMPIVPDRVAGVVLDDRARGEYLLYVQESRRELLQTVQGRRVLRYMEENDVGAVPKRGMDKKLRPVSELSSVKSHRPFWYSLKLPRPAPIFLSLFADKKIKVYENAGGFHALNNFAGFAPDVPGNTRAYLAFLSSSWFALFLEKRGHVAGGNALQVKTGDYMESPVPDFGQLDGQAGRGRRARQRAAHSIMSTAWDRFREDLDQGKLDRAVLGALGFDAGEMRQIADDLGESVGRRLGS